MMNFTVIGLAALVPIIIGFLWYHPSLFGKAWMKASGVTQDMINKSKMGVILLLSLLFSLFLSMEMNFVAIHQGHLYSLVADEPGFMEEGSEVMTDLNAFLGKYGDNFRTFKHGSFHGILAGFFFALPILGINALFERKGFRYIAIHTGYWIVTLGLMGGIICQWS